MLEYIQNSWSVLIVLEALQQKEGGIIVHATKERSMKVVELKTVEGKVRYYLADDTGAPVQPVLKYLKFKDNIGYARNTLRMHCIHLKHFFTYLGEAEKDYEQVNIDDLAGFLAWLKNPDILKKVVALRFESEHQPQTINAMVDTVVIFYDSRLFMIMDIRMASLKNSRGRILKNIWAGLPGTMRVGMPPSAARQFLLSGSTLTISSLQSTRRHRRRM